MYQTYLEISEYQSNQLNQRQIDLDPVAYTPPPNPGFQKEYAPNNKLAAGELVLEGVGVGPEDIAMSPDSLLYTGFAVVERDVDWRYSSARDYAGLRKGSLCNLEMGKSIMNFI